MKILFVTPWFPILNADSAEINQGLFEYKQLLEMVKRGHEFSVITMHWRDQSVPEDFGDKIEVHRIKPFYVFQSIRYPIPNVFELDSLIRKIINEYSPDVVIYSHMAFLTALPVLWFKKVPSVVTTDCFPGISWFYGDKRVDFVGRLYTKIIMKRMIKSSNGLQLFNSKLLDDEKSVSVKFKNVLICSTGVDTDTFRPGDRLEARNKLNLSGRDVVILYVGRMDLVKGVNYLIEAAKVIVQKYKRVKFILVGDGGLRREYEILADSFNNIIFLGWRNDIPELMRMADIFVLPSLSEGVPNVVMEASSSGLPVIASDVGGVSQLITNQETGILIRSRDKDALVSAICKLVEEPLFAENLGKKGRTRMIKNYSWGIICEKLEKYYDGIVAAGNR
jgi:glycosyltransferase involved in cell wall biosynthesis